MLRKEDIRICKIIFLCTFALNIIVIAVLDKKLLPFLKQIIIFIAAHRLNIVRFSVIFCLGIMLTLWIIYAKTIWAKMEQEDIYETIAKNKNDAKAVDMPTTYSAYRANTDTQLNENSIEVINSYLKQLQEVDKKFLESSMLHNICVLKSMLRLTKHQINVHSELTGDIMKFLNKYMPTTLQLISSYVNINQQVHVTKSIVEAKESIEKSIDMVISALEQQLNNIEEMNILDATITSEAMQNMLALNGYIDTLPHHTNKVHLVVHRGEKRNGTK